jgi:hypothetical protein
MEEGYGKWPMHQKMIEEEELISCLPETSLYSKKSFWELIIKHGAVVIKPSKGLRGNGVVMVSVVDENRFEIHNQDFKIIVDRNVLDIFLAEKSDKGKTYIVQERIPLAAIDGCPFDIRVMVQRKQGSQEWCVTGKAVKVASQNFAITNVSREILTLEQAVERSELKGVDFELLESEINRISLITAYTLGEHFQNARTFGLDMGVTNNGTIYIIEVNLKPSSRIFKELPDKQMLKKIREYRL